MGEHIHINQDRFCRAGGLLGKEDLLKIINYLIQKKIHMSGKMYILYFVSTIFLKLFYMLSLIIEYKIK